MSSTNGGDSYPSRRFFLKVMGITVAGVSGYILLDSTGYLGPRSPIRRYLNSQELAHEAAKYGDDGDRVAYAVNYLSLPSEMVAKTMQSWNSVSSAVKSNLGNAVPTPTAAIVAEELSNPETTTLAQRYPNLLWTHAHSNAIFTFPWITLVQKVDQRLVKMADLRLSESQIQAQGQVLDLYYPEDDPKTPGDYGKRQYIREGFAFFAKNFGDQLEEMDSTDSAIITEQSIAESVTASFSGPIFPLSPHTSSISAEAGDTLIFFNTQDVPIYVYSAVDGTRAIGDQVPYGSLAVGLETMKRFRDRHPSLHNSPELPLLQQGYIQIDDLFIQDTEFKKYLYQGFYKGAFSTSPEERTFSWKQYQTVGLVPEQTVRGFGVAEIDNFHPAHCQPLSLLKVAPSIVEILVQSPEIYVPSHWHLGRLFEPYTG